MFDIEFEELNSEIDVEFEHIQTASDGGFERGYEEGYSKGNENGYNKGYELGQTEGFEQGYGQGYEQSKVDNPNPLEYATGVSYRQSVFPDDFDLLVDIPNFTGDSVSGFFYGAKGLRSIKMTCDNKEVVWEGTNFCYATTQPTTLKIVDLSEFTTKVKTAINLFLNQMNLVSILGVWDMSECTNFLNIVLNCNSLEEMRFVKETIKYNIAFAHSPLLSNESIQSIIDGLADLTEQTTQTVTFHANVKAKLTIEQQTTIMLKNWQIG